MDQSGDRWEGASTVVSGADEVVPAVQSSLSRGGVGVVIVRTDRAANVRLHDELHAAVATALASAPA